jgi:hypothetical protein
VVVVVVDVEADGAGGPELHVGVAELLASLAAAKENPMTTSETTQVTGGWPMVGSLRSASRRRKGPRQVTVVDLHSEGMS